MAYSLSLQRPPAARPIAVETKRILALAWPVALTSLNWTILQLSDVVVVGLTGTGEVAALGASRALTIVGIMVSIGVLSSILVFTSRADGAGNRPATGRVLQEGVVLALLLGLGLGLALFVSARPLLMLIGVEPTLAARAARVVQAFALGYPPQLVMLAASFFLEGVSRPRRVMTINLTTLPLNAVLAWAWSGGHLGLPAMGATGAALATSCVAAIGAVAMLLAVWTLPDAVARGVRDWRSRTPIAMLRSAAGLLRFGAMPGLSSGLELAGFSVLIALSTRLGETSAHAFQIVFAVHNVTFGVALGLGSAAGVRVGNAIGEGVPTRAMPRALIAAAIAAVVTGLLALCLVLGRAMLVSAFPATEAVHVLAMAMLTLWAPFILFDGIQIVLLYTLRSLGDQVAAGINSIIAYFVVTSGVGLWLVHVGAGPLGLAIASGVGMVTAALLHGARFVAISARLRRKN